MRTQIRSHACRSCVCTIMTSPKGNCIIHNAGSLKFSALNGWRRKRTRLDGIKGEHTRCVSCQCLSLLIGSIPGHVFSSIASLGVIYYHLPCQSGLWSPPSIFQSRQLPRQPPPPTPTSPPEYCSAPCSVFKPITEGTYSDNYSVDVALYHKRVGRDVRWMVIWKQRREETGRSWNKRTEGYLKVRQIREKRGESQMKEKKRWESMLRKQRRKFSRAAQCNRKYRIIQWSKSLFQNRGKKSAFRYFKSWKSAA